MVAAPRPPTTTKVTTARDEAVQTVAGAETEDFFSLYQEGMHIWGGGLEEGSRKVRGRFKEGSKDSPRARS